MEEIDYKNLYQLQDEVLKIIFETEQEFYLTGGTCINRFYIEKRYSDDLDFFANNSKRFHFAVKNIANALQKKQTLQREVDAKDFKRFRVNNTLQIDFVNDRAARFGDVVLTKENFLIDNLENIASNKINAIVGRDEAKDIFDLFIIYNNFSFSWKKILQEAHSKTYFEDEELIVRLKTFPKSWIKNIKFTENKFFDEFFNDFDKTLAKIIEEVFLFSQRT